MPSSPQVFGHQFLCRAHNLSSLPPHPSPSFSLQRHALGTRYPWR